MSSDYEEKEREFLAYLKADTGRDLAGWMQAIGEANLAHRDEIIEWLRQQGFIFTWASWLERIHHNGGRPIYLTEVPPSIAQPPRSSGARSGSTGTGTPVASDGPSPAAPVDAGSAAVTPRPPSRPVLVYSAPAPQNPAAPAATIPAAAPPQPQPPPEPAPPVRPTPPPPTPRAEPSAAPVARAPVSSAPSADIANLVAKAKAYAPLANFLLRSIGEAVPGAVPEATGNYIAFNRPQTFAILVPGPKDIKLGLALASAPFERFVTPARFTNLSPPPPKSIAYMAVLTDARQIDAALLELLRAADAAING